MNQEDLIYKFSISNGKETIIISTEDILYVEADSNYSMIYLAGGKKFLSIKKIKELEEILPPSYFQRVHNSYIVNMLYINKLIVEEECFLELENGSMIPLARRRKSSFLENFKKI